MNQITTFNKTQLLSTLTDIRPGDTVKIFQKVKEGDKTRLQPFEGLVIARKHGKGISATVTVRKVSGGIGVEKIIPIHSPTIAKVEVLKRAKVRRAKLYYIRAKAAREVRRKMKGLVQMREVKEANGSPSQIFRIENLGGQEEQMAGGTSTAEEAK